MGFEPTSRDLTMTPASKAGGLSHSPIPALFVIEDVQPETSDFGLLGQLVARLFYDSYFSSSCAPCALAFFFLIDVEVRWSVDASAVTGELTDA